MRNGALPFVGTEIGTGASEVVVHAGQPEPPVFGSGAPLQAEVEVGRLVERARVGTRCPDLLEDVEVDKDAVTILAGGTAVFVERLESPSLARLCLEQRLLLCRERRGLARKVCVHRQRGRAPLERELGVLVRAESVV